MNAFVRRPAWVQTDPIVRVVFSEIAAELGFGIVPNVFHAMAAMPDLLDAQWCAVRATLLRGRLSRALKEMIGLVVSREYSRALCLQSLTRQGVDLDVVAAVACGHLRTPRLSRRETDVLEHVRDGAERGLSLDDKLEAAAAAQMFATLDRFAHVAGVPADLW